MRNVVPAPGSSYISTMNRRVWLFYPDQVGRSLLGPGVRIHAIAHQLALAGHDVHVALQEGSEPDALPGTLHVLERDLLSKVRPGDALLVSGYLSGRMLGDLVASDIPFHTDFYCLTAPEILRHPRRNPIREFRQRRSRILRYQVTIRRSERVYVSNALQTAFLGGSFFRDLSGTTNRFVDALPERIVEFPMGIPDEPMPEPSTDPYPEPLRSRPVFLWGGGIWSWFDVPTLLRAMRILADRGSDAALFFLGGRTLSGREEHERPIREAIALSESLGLLDRHVFFNERRAEPSELPGYLRHCAAGAMSNPPSFESLASWRTRYLDLLWAGKPLVASGTDPLGVRMKESGAALLAPAGDAGAMADAMASIATDSVLARTLGEASLRLGGTMTWSHVARPLLEAVADPSSFRLVPEKPSRAWMLRYRLGI